MDEQLSKEKMQTKNFVNIDLIIVIWKKMYFYLGRISLSPP